jgi:RNA polymerase sigma-70 factor, ECF subfamily
MAGRGSEVRRIEAAPELTTGPPPQQNWPAERSRSTMSIPVGRTIAAHAEGQEVAGSQASFEAFFEDTHRRLFGSLCLVTGNRHEAEEVMQDAYLRLWERWDRVQTMDNPNGFLFQTAMNLFRSRYRRAKLGLRRHMWLAPGTDDLAEVEDRDEVVRILRPLTAAERASVVLTTMFGYSSEEAGRILRVKAATVRAHATRARADARAQMQEERS